MIKMKMTHGLLDRSKWPDGPWNSEPDRIEWRVGGFPCLMVRQETFGAWCGYVAVPPGHPWHGLHYDLIAAETHGGLTYADRCQGPICHVPENGEPDNVWWVGFDCLHAWDAAPGLDWRLKSRTGLPEGFSEYRDVEYVRGQVEKLAAQAFHAGSKQ